MVATAQRSLTKSLKEGAVNEVRLTAPGNKFAQTPVFRTELGTARRRTRWVVQTVEFAFTPSIEWFKWNKGEAEEFTFILEVTIYAGGTNVGTTLIQFQVENNAANQQAFIPKQMTLELYAPAELRGTSLEIEVKGNWKEAESIKAFQPGTFILSEPIINVVYSQSFPA